ncbi:phosphate ABC transporter permease subunit PstC [Sinanaerobacter chloroacetimidivorans]|jgi:phosphate transport system permease protein|uniref:Phosphate transport system permease protein n=1 Tax=Sinanaerobacter chloroacetimidivorans TaxID=2818044 RepID=A0A8J8B0U6_9FIRM|nr:phosphate ABC transporter permease subunit PstC [Sinanaerobacter chloroacetimidivorans]MBR0597142.1 phosphate ABC transporter permease subunit PstC [Sinanaerobacter chloroacetimidivorans]
MKTYERIIEKLILISAVVATISVALITIFIFQSGLPVLASYGVFDFILGTTWSPTNGSYGILPLIAGTLSVTFGALVIGIPTGIACAVFLAEILPAKWAKGFKSAIELLAGIPSVVYGFFGLVVLVPAIRNYILPIYQFFNPDKSTTGFSILAGAVILAIMILPTIVSISENSIAAVPREYKEASLALGANKMETIIKVLIPAAKSGIISSIILGMGRAIGETMAVLLITGNMAKIPGSILDPVATLTGTIAMEMGYASPTHQQALFAVGIILFVIIMLLNIIAQVSMKGIGGKAS